MGPRTLDLPPADPHDDDDPRSLLESLRQGDVEALRTAFARYADPLARLAHQYLQSRDAAQDVVQEAFIRLWDDRARLDPRGNLLGLLRTIVRRRALDLLKHARLARAWAHDAAAAADHAHVAPPDQALEAHEVSAALAHVIAGLPPRMRAVAVMRWHEQLGRTEIAEALGVSVRTVDAQIQAASHHLRTALAFIRAR